MRRFGTGLLIIVNSPNDPVVSIPVPALSPGQEKIVTFDVAGLPPGTYPTHVYADYGKKLNTINYKDSDVSDITVKAGDGIPVCVRSTRLRYRSCARNGSRPRARSAGTDRHCLRLGRPWTTDDGRAA